MSDESALSTADAAFPTISKADAVRAVLEDGVEKPKDGVARIKDKFGLTMTTQQFSQYKTLGKKKANGGGVKAESNGRALAPSANGHAGVASSVEAIKQLVERLGVEEVVSIARLFSR